MHDLNLKTWNDLKSVTVTNSLLGTEYKNVNNISCQETLGLQKHREIRFNRLAFTVRFYSHMKIFIRTTVLKLLYTFAAIQVV